ncbi:MAG TPA: M1 family aminopeptidase, partial [Polyangiaceae bacterium]|nr:M1 family aminopeptidase [Polyangiaceae bacterium]
LRLKTKKSDGAWSNTPAVSETVEGDYKVVQFAETKPLPAYVVAFGVGPFETVDAGVAGRNRTAVRIIVPRGRSAEAQFAKETTPQVLSRLEDYFGIPYPYEKLDILDVPAFPGAMENPGLVTFGQQFLLSEHLKETTKFKRLFTATAVHELAHQWFGDLVTASWWDDAWLNEGFATWAAHRVVEDWKPEWHEDTARVRSTARAMRGDSLASARSIRQPIASKDDIANAFDEITYEKGAAVLDMFENWVGRDAFRAGVNRYLVAHAHGNATAAQFLSAVFGSEEAPAARAFATFLDQPGIPLVTASLQCTPGQTPKLAVTRGRYSPIGMDAPRDSNWQIPICVRYPGKSGIARTCALLAESQAEIPLVEAASSADGKPARCPAWVDANAHAHGYYRVLYQGDLLAKVRAHAATDLTAAEKVSLLGDLAALVRTKALSYGDALSMVPALTRDPVTDVALSTFDLVTAPRDLDMFPEALRPRYARFVRDTYGARARKLGFAPHPGEDEDTRLLRTRLLSLVADQGEDRALRAEAAKLASRWFEDPKAVDPDAVETILSIAALGGDRALLDRMLAAARALTNRFERDQILLALGHFRDPDTLRAALGVLLAPDVDPIESTLALRDTQTTAATRDIAYDFVKRNFEAMAKRLPGDFAARIPKFVGASFCDASHARDLEDFFHKRAPQFPGGPRMLAQSVEAVKLCSAYRALQEPNVRAFLQTK